jgi:hypothetical protein
MNILIPELNTIGIEENHDGQNRITIKIISPSISCPRIACGTDQ